jgi:purine-nucleoside phosphorylase
MLPLASDPVAPPDVRAAAAELRARLGGEPFAAALVLGSGLGGFVDAVSDPRVVGFDELAGYPASGVVGHAGRWIAGRLAGRRILVQAGRYHRYEGLPRDLVTAPVRTAAALGVPILVLTNAAGSVRRAFGPGTLVALEDHIDLMEGQLPTTRPREREAPYDPELRLLAARCAERVGVPLGRGCYAALSGPSYETPAEIRLLDRLGADLVGMSTVPEAVAARGEGMRCLALSLVTNWAAGIAPGPLDHADVIEVGRRSAARLETLLREIVRELPDG